jgi:exodeoxyribonuclease VII small subunit
VPESSLTGAIRMRYFSRLPSTPRMTKPSPQQPPKTFESALAELEKIVQAMEAGQLPLDESIAAYRRGAELLQFCQTALKQASQQVQLLEAGVLKDFTLDGEPAVADGAQ